MCITRKENFSSINHSGVINLSKFNIDTIVSSTHSRFTNCPSNGLSDISPFNTWPSLGSGTTVGCRVSLIAFILVHTLRYFLSLMHVIYFEELVPFLEGE